MKYVDLNISYEKPYVWKRSEEDKLPDKGKAYTEIKKDIDEFKHLKEGVKKEISEVYNKNIDISHTRGVLNQRIGEVSDFYSKAIIPCEDLDANFLLQKTNKNTLNKKLQPWCKNLVYNIPEVMDSKPYQDLIGKFKDIPAFVITAGPSLKNNREKLKKVKGKALIICVDTSLRPLLDIGVVPDICVTHDANPNGCKFFLSKDHQLNKENAQLNNLRDEQLAMIFAMLENDKKRLEFKYDTLGLFVNYCHPLTLKAWNGREKRFYGVFDPSLPVYEMMAACTNYKMDENKKLVPDSKGRVVGGSSVGHVAMYIAVALGCNPISFLGLDLSYPGGKTYVEGASNQKDVSKQKLITMNGLSRKKVETNLSMLSYKMVFEKTFPNIAMQVPSLRFYNTTCDENGMPSGILECGAMPKNIDDVIKEFCQKEIDLSALRSS